MRLSLYLLSLFAVTVNAYCWDMSPESCNGTVYCVRLGDQCKDHPYRSSQWDVQLCSYCKSRRTVEDCENLETPVHLYGNRIDGSCKWYENSCLSVSAFCSYKEEECEIKTFVSEYSDGSPSAEGDKRSGRVKGFDKAWYWNVHSYYTTFAQNGVRLYQNIHSRSAIRCSVDSDFPGSDYGITTSTDSTILAQQFKRSGTNKMGTWLIQDTYRNSTVNDGGVNALIPSFETITVRPKDKEDDDKETNWDYEMRAYYQTHKLYLTFFYIKSSKLDRDMVEQESMYYNAAVITCRDWRTGLETKTKIKTYVEENFNFVLKTDDFTWSSK